ncbi:hypothetical protein U1Q18_003656 [Sarracenia purpurea var. burkii]
MNTRVSYADAVYPDELDEEFDTFPMSQSVDLVRMRSDQLTSLAGSIQNVVGYVAIQGEQVLAVIAGIYVLRHPRFQHKLLAAPLSFLHWLLARTDSML